MSDQRVVIRKTGKMLKQVQHDINNKIPDNKSHRVLYGASNGLNFEPYYVEFLHLCLHDEETIEEVKLFLA